MTQRHDTNSESDRLRVDFHYDDIEDLVEATQLDGEEAARGGDSGGPVYSVNADGTVLAAGTTTRSAGPGFGFQDFATARDDYGNLVPATPIASTCRVSFVVTDSWSTGYTDRWRSGPWPDHQRRPHRRYPMVKLGCGGWL